jgi:hypothetical protein
MDETDEPMTTYLQMGHHSENLLTDPGLRRFKGAILSPVNNVEAEIARQISGAGSQLETVFDPQLYFPYSERGCLRRWAYFPTDVDTADFSSEAWWRAVVEKIAATCLVLRPTAACSPALVPRVHTNE